MAGKTTRRLLSAILGGVLMLGGVALPAQAGDDRPSPFLMPQKARLLQGADADRVLARLGANRGSGAAVVQRGRNNKAGVGQSGRRNRALVLQQGRGHTGTIRQNGNRNAAALIQLGRGTTGHIVQTGNRGRTVLILQGW